MSINVKSHKHGELLSSLLLGIETVPVKEQTKMIRICIKEAVKAYDEDVKKTQQKNIKDDFWSFCNYVCDTLDGEVDINSLLKYIPFIYKRWKEGLEDGIEKNVVKELRYMCIPPKINQRFVNNNNGEIAEVVEVVYVSSDYEKIPVVIYKYVQNHVSCHSSLEDFVALHEDEITKNDNA